MVTARKIETARQPFIDYMYLQQGYNESLIEHVIRLSGFGFRILPTAYGIKRPLKGLPLSEFNQHKRLQWDEYPDWVRKLWIGKKNLLILCGRASGNLLVIDYDEQAAFEQAVLIAKSHWGHVFAVRTGRGGHLYFRTNLPVKPLKDKKFAGGDIKGAVSGNYVIAPPSYNADKGTLYCWHEATELTQAKTGVPVMSPPVTTANELVSVLGLRDLQGQPVKLVSIGRAQRAASEKGQQERAQYADYVENGHLLPEGQRNPTLYKIACIANRHNLDIAPVKAAAAASGLPDREITSVLERVSKTTRKSIGTQHADKARLQAWIAGIDLSGRTAATDRAVLQALLTRYMQDADSEGAFHASLRTVAQIAVKEKKTVQAAINRLIVAGLLLRVSPLEGERHASSAAMRYKFNLGSMSEIDTTNSLLGGVDIVGSLSDIVNSNTDLQALDSMRRSGEKGGLRGQAVPVYKYLCQQSEAKTQAEIARALGIHRETARTAIYDLLQHGLIDCYDKRYIAQYDQHKIQRAVDYLETIQVKEKRQARIQQRSDRERHNFLFEKIEHALWKDEDHKNAVKALRALVAQQQPAQPDTAQHPSGHDQQQHTQPAIVQDELILELIQLGGVIREDDNQKRGRNQYIAGD